MRGGDCCPVDLLDQFVTYQSTNNRLPETHEQHFIKGVPLLPAATKAAQNGAAAPAAAVTETVAAAFTHRSTVAGDIRTRITEALTTIIQTAAGKAYELSDAVTTELRIAAMMVDDPQAGHHLGDPTAWV